MGKSGGGGGGGGGDYTTTVRYAPYVETKHSAFLDAVDAARIAAIAAGSPYTTYTEPELEDAFFGAGYTLASFPTLYDMFGKFMAGLDIEVLWEQIFGDTVNNPEVGTLVAAEGAMLDDDIELNLLPRFQTGMRDMNAVMTSSFVVGKAIIEDARVKSINKFSAELRYKLIPVAHERWAAHLNWNNGVLKMYAELLKFYYAAKHDVDEQSFSMKARTALWPFTVLEYERAALGAMQGATTMNKDVAGGSTAQNVIGGALGGAAAGALIGAEIGAVGGPMGAAIGGVLGGLAGLFG